MAFPLATITDKVFSSIKPGPLTDDHVLQLHLIFSEDLILAALDIIDRSSVIKHTTLWGGVHYEVFGSTASYLVYPDLATPSGSRIPKMYCSCPTFTHTTLLAKEPQLMCKHLLATRLAIQLQQCVDRAMSDDELATLVSHSA